MSTRARRTCQHLEALGFVRDLGLSTRDKYVYTHPNDPTPLRVFVGLTETTARAIRAKRWPFRVSGRKLSTRSS